MSLIERAIVTNRKKAVHHDPSPAHKPAPKIAILTCMDPRLNELLQWLDIKPADADVIRIAQCELKPGQRIAITSPANSEAIDAIL
jgi:carbonic anhydrase